MEETKREFQNDHDAIIALVVEVRQARTEIKEVKDEVRSLKDDTARRVDALEREKLDKIAAEKLQEAADEVHDSFDKRITWLERIAYGGMGILAAIELYFRFLK